MGPILLRAGVLSLVQKARLRFRKRGSALRFARWCAEALWEGLEMIVDMAVRQRDCHPVRWVSRSLW